MSVDVDVPLYGTFSATANLHCARRDFAAFAAFARAGSDLRMQYVVKQKCILFKVFVKFGAIDFE